MPIHPVPQGLPTPGRGTRRQALAGQAFEFLFRHQIHHRDQISPILNAFGRPNNYSDNGADPEGSGA